jgi:hypothetical protein
LYRQQLYVCGGDRRDESKHADYATGATGKRRKKKENDTENLADTGRKMNDEKTSNDARTSNGVARGHVLKTTQKPHTK